MPLRPIAVSMSVVALVSLAIAPPLGAQSREKPGRRAAFTAGASFGDGETALALSAGLIFPLSARLGLDVEIAYARRLDFTVDACAAPLTCALDGQLPATGRTVSLVPHILLELHMSPRLSAYAQAGVGAGHVRQRYFAGPPFTGSVAEPVEFTRSSIAVVISFGGGATAQISRRLAVGADVRALHVLDEEAKVERPIMPSGALRTLRVGSRISWQF